MKNIESNYTSYDLIEENDLIEDETIKINNNNMKFNTVVGNPPYQGKGGSELVITMRPYINTLVELLQAYPVIMFHL